MSAVGVPGDVELSTAHLRVVVRAHRGADIASMVDLASGTSILNDAPWPKPDPRAANGLEASQADWLAAYRGGWQLLIPNAGPARTREGRRQGYHGEASIAKWTVLARSAESVEVEVALTSAPLVVHRTITLVERALVVDETVTNSSPDPVRFSWVQHPVFGAPFVDGDARIETDATEIVTDANGPGDLLPRDSVLPYPRPTGSVDLSRVPSADSGHSVFGALTGFSTGRFRIVSPTAGLAIAMDWELDDFPYAWFWQECNANPGFPWYRRAYAIAIEPANVLPGGGVIAGAVRGRTDALPGHRSVSTRISLTCEPL